VAVGAVEVRYRVYGSDGRVAVTETRDHRSLCAVEVVTLDHQREDVAEVLADVLVGTETRTAAVGRAPPDLAEQARGRRVEECVRVLRAVARGSDLVDQREV